MESTYIIETQEPNHVINAKEYLKKAEETNCLGVELSKYRKALNTLLNENKRLEQNERHISDEMETIEYFIDSLYPPKPLWIEGYEINSSNTNKNISKHLKHKLSKTYVNLFKTYLKPI